MKTSKLLVLAFSMLAFFFISCEKETDDSLTSDPLCRNGNRSPIFGSDCIPISIAPFENISGNYITFSVDDAHYLFRSPPLIEAGFEDEIVRDYSYETLISNISSTLNSENPAIRIEFPNLVSCRQGICDVDERMEMAFREIQSEGINNNSFPSTMSIRIGGADGSFWESIRGQPDDSFFEITGMTKLDSKVYLLEFNFQITLTSSNNSMILREGKGRARFGKFFDL